jgi:hypothetical protein
LRNAALGKNERLLPQVITAFFREQSACNGRPATCGLRRSCFDLRVRRDATMRTAPRAALAAYRGHDARPQGDFLRLPSLLASRPTVVEPVPGRAVYHAAWSMPRTPPNDVCLHAPPSFMLCVRQGMGVAAFTAPSCSLDGKGAVLWTGGACRWRAPRPSLPVALASRTRSVDPFRG